MSGIGVLRGATTVVAGVALVVAASTAGPGAAVSAVAAGGPVDDRVEIVVRDGHRDAQGDRRVRHLAELTRVRYVVAPGGEKLTVTARFARLDQGGRGGAVSQHVGVLISEVSECQDNWVVSANNAGRARMTYDDYCEGEFGVARPETLEVQGRWGLRGTLRLVVSTELFDQHDIRLRTVGQVGDGRARDFTRSTRRIAARDALRSSVLSV